MADKKTIEKAARFLATQLAAYSWMPDLDDDGETVDIEVMADELYNDALLMAEKMTEGSDKNGA
jgi:hypothetical protein